MSSDLVGLVQRLSRPRILVVGDLMLDRYIWGDAARISQEAPVMLLQVDRREEKLGGASSVATMLAALDAEVVLAGVVGVDAAGERVRAMLAEMGVDQHAVLSDSSRPTTVKERYIGRAQQKHPQQILRVDYECRAPLDAAVERRLAAQLTEQLQRCAIVLVSDYDKGVCTPSLLAALADAAREAGVRIVADPIRGGDYAKYRHYSAITPNRLEAGLAAGFDIRTAADALRAGDELRCRLDLEAAIVTLDKDGMALVSRDGQRDVFPTRPRQVYDITGAGDMVLSVLGLALASGADYPQAIRLANVAGGLEVEKVGVATVSRDEIIDDLIHGGANTAATKLVALPALVGELDRRRRAGQRIAFTNGCFDVVHAGHIQYLQEARAQADVLVVALNSDSSVRMLKGPSRPVNPAAARALVLAGMQAVDFVTVFDEPTPIALIEAIRPDVLVKGADYRRSDVVGAEFVEAHGGRVHLAAFRDGFSTTGLLERMKAA